MKIAFYGDSITADDDGEYGVKGYPSYLKESLQIEYENRGVRGETLLQILNRVDKDDLSSFDVLSIYGGANDFLQGATTISNYNDLIGYMIKYICEKLHRSYPNIHIIVCIPTQCWLLHRDTGCIIHSERALYYEYMKNAICADAHIVDLYGIPELNGPYNSMYTDTFERDGWMVHPNSDGHKFIASKFEKVLIQWM